MRACLVCVGLCLSIFCFCQQRYWRGLVSTDWNNSGNWASSSGGAGGAGIPGSSDVVTFDASFVNSCILNSTTSVNQVSITAGSLTLGSAAVLNVASNFGISGGTLTLDAASSSTVNANGVFNSTGGIINGGGGTINIPNNTVILNGGTINGQNWSVNVGKNIIINTPNTILPGTGTVTFNGSTQQDVVIVSGTVPGKLQFYNLVINKPGNSLINFTSSITDTFQVNNEVRLVAGILSGNGFIKVERNLFTEATFGGSGVPVATTGVNPSVITLKAPISVNGVTAIVGIAKSDKTIPTDIYWAGAGDTLRIGNFNATFIVRRGTLNFPGTNAVVSSFGKIQIEPEGIFNAPGYLANAGQHINLGGVFNANGGTYVFNQPSIPAATQFTNHVEQFYNLVINLPTSQFNPSANDTLVVNGNLILRGGTITGGSQSSFNVKGNMVVESTMSPTQTNTNLVFSGTADQNLVFAAGTEGYWNANVTINKSSGKLILGSPMILDEFGGRLFTFTRGIVQTTATNYLLFANSYNVMGASNISYVDGPVQQRWYDGFTFPIGNGSFYAPVRITSSQNDVFTAQYFHQDPTPLYNTSLFAGTLQNVSKKEYWMLSKTGTSTPPYGWLSYDNIRSGGVTDPTKLRVARWDGTQWTDLGNGAVYPPFVRTTNLVPAFSPFTLASADKLLNPLPVHFISFTAERLASGVLLKWTTAEEVNNDHFDIQRSPDGIQFTDIGRVNAQAPGQNVYNYEFVDNSLAVGRNYYRLQQVDKDGTKSYSVVVSVVNATTTETNMQVYPNPAYSFATVRCKTLANKSAWFEITDSKGALISRQRINLDAAGEWKLKQLPARGVYVLRISDDNNHYHQSLVVQ